MKCCFVRGRSSSLDISSQSLEQGARNWPHKARAVRARASARRPGLPAALHSHASESAGRENCLRAPSIRLHSASARCSLSLRYATRDSNSAIHFAWPIFFLQREGWRRRRQRQQAAGSADGHVPGIKPHKRMRRATDSRALHWPQPGDRFQQCSVAKRVGGARGATRAPPGRAILTSLAWTVAESGVVGLRYRRPLARCPREQRVGRTPMFGDPSNSAKQSLPRTGRPLSAPHPPGRKSSEPREFL